MNKLLSVSQQTSNKHLNMFLALYSTKRGQVCYQIASRKAMQNLALHTPQTTQADAVRMLPYFVKNGEKHVVLIREFRFALNRYIYGLPAGLIDNDETAEQAVARELREEIGASLISCQQTEDALFTSAGLTDESVAFFTAEVKLSHEQQLDTTEDITLITLPITQLKMFMQNNLFCMQSKLQLKIFLLEEMLAKQKKEQA